MDEKDLRDRLEGLFSNLESPTQGEKKGRPFLWAIWKAA
jgi:hypothetical protein